MTSSIESVDLSNLPSYQMPESIQELINRASQNHYEELYEEEADGSITLEDTLTELIGALKSKEDYHLTHRRYIYMGMVLALAVAPTIETYLPENKTIKEVFSFVTTWFATEGISEAIPKPQQINELFPQLSWGYQAVDEAMDVLKNLLLALDYDRAKQALLDMFDDCFEGYAIIIGSSERRQLFDWFLLDVYPAIYHTTYSKYIYTFEGIALLTKEYLTDTISQNIDRIEASTK